MPPLSPLALQTASECYYTVYAGDSDDAEKLIPEMAAHIQKALDEVVRNEKIVNAAGNQASPNQWRDNP